MKKIDILGWIILISILASTTLLDFRFKQIRKDIEAAQIPKITVIDNSQLNRLCTNLVSQWGGKSHVLYVLQPNSQLKTHKELITKSVNVDLPIRLDLSDYKNLKYCNSYYIGTDFGIFIEQDFEEVSIEYVLIPIYKNSIIIGEFIVFFEDGIKGNLESHASEAQIISSLLN